MQVTEYSDLPNTDRQTGDSDKKYTSPRDMTDGNVFSSFLHFNILRRY